MRGGWVEEAGGEGRGTHEFYLPMNMQQPPPPLLGRYTKQEQKPLPQQQLQMNEVVVGRIGSKNNGGGTVSPPRLRTDNTRFELAAG